MERQDLPDGVTICETCGEFYPAELTLSDLCEICDFYEDDDSPIIDGFDFGDWIGDVDGFPLELEEM